jgi:hypothetical protein
MQDFGELERECEVYAECVRAEAETRLRLVKELKPLLALLKHPVSLDLRMRGLFPEAVKLKVGSDFSLKAVYSSSSPDRVPLLSLEDAFVALAKEVAAKVKAELEARRKRELARSRPKLRAELRVEKKRIPIFGRWKYHLVVFNLGGDALSVAVTTRYGSKERLLTSPDIPKGDSADWDLEDYRELSRSGKVDVDLACADSLRIPYTGTVELPQKGGYRSVKLNTPAEQPD